MIKNYLTACAVCLFIVSAQGQTLLNSTDVKFTEFLRPPYPITILNIGLNPAGGVRYQAAMPIAGRMAARTDAAKLRGAEVSPSGTYVYTGQTDAAGGAQSGQGLVFSSPNPRVKVAPDTPTDWAVWGTNSDDGPLRLPFGGDYSQLVSQVTTPATQVTALESLISSGSGLNYDTYSLYPRYRVLSRAVDPASGRLITRVEETKLQQAESQAKTMRYIAVADQLPEEMGRVVALAANRFEGIATHFVKDDKNASARRVSFLTFDDAGTPLKDQVVNFTYNRALTMRIPVADPAGKAVGTLNVFGPGPGKKDAQDPDENRFSIVVTDEQGGIWSQFEWTANGSGNRAVIPAFAVRQGDQLLMHSTNQQKILKPVEESWSFDRTGKATLLNSMPYGDISGLSKEVGTVSPENRTGWFNYTTARYIDSFTEANGEIWVLMQRNPNPAVAGNYESVTAAPVPEVTSGVLGFANKLNRMAGQPARAIPTTSTNAVAATTRPNDLFVLHLDKNLVLKQQTVVALQAGYIRLKRIVTPGGVLYVFNDNANTLLTIKGNELTVQRLRPADGMVATSTEVDNFVVDETAGKLYLLYSLPKKAGQGRLLTYDLK